MNQLLNYIFILVIILFGLILAIYEWFRFFEDVSKPKGLNFTLLFKGDDMGLVYGFSCEAAGDSDVVERRLVVNVNGADVSTKLYEATATDLGEFTFVQDDNVVLTLVDIDDVGNVSGPATVEFVAADTIPPSVPGGFTVSLLREVDDAPVTPDETIPDPPDLETT